jgi:hypothetical protein
VSCLAIQIEGVCENTIIPGVLGETTETRKRDISGLRSADLGSLAHALKGSPRDAQDSNGRT